MRKSLISILIAIIVVSVFGVANASSANINLGASSEKVKVGDTFTVSIVGIADNNIAGLEANIEYDKDKLKIENKTVGTGFYDYPAGENEVAIGLGSEENIELSKNATLCTFTFKVLEGAKTGETVIEFKDIKLALVNAEKQQEEVSVANESIEIEIEKVEEEPKEENKKEDTDKKPANTNKDDNKLPQTGIEEVSIIAIAILAVIATVSYVSYNKYKNI